MKWRNGPGRKGFEPNGIQADARRCSERRADPATWLWSCSGQPGGSIEGNAVCRNPGVRLLIHGLVLTVCD